MQLTQVSLVNTRKGEGWELHRAGCQDVGRTVAKYHASAFDFEADSLEDAIDYVIDSELREMGYTADEYLDIFPCVKFPKE